MQQSSFDLDTGTSYDIGVFTLAFWVGHYFHLSTLYGAGNGVMNFPQTTQVTALPLCTTPVTQPQSGHSPTW